MSIDYALDNNNPREAQAREVIDVWVSQGYSLRHIIIDALISYQRGESHNSELEEILEKITRLLETTNEGGESDKVVQRTFPEDFVRSISKSVKSSIRVK